jgi:hypothetical protein
MQNIDKYKRVNRSYSPKGPMTRAALDFSAKRGSFSHFWTDFHGLSGAEKQNIVIEMFNDRQVVSATFSMFIPENEHCRQPFTIVFAQTDKFGTAEHVVINIKSVTELRAQAKLYPRDATAYAAVGKTERKTRAIEKAL